MEHAFDHWPVVRLLGKQKYLFGSLLALLLVFPLVTSPPFQRPVLNAVLTLIIITGPLSLAARRNQFLIAAVLAATMWIPGWIDSLIEGTLAGFIDVIFIEETLRKSPGVGRHHQAVLCVPPGAQI